MAVAIASSFEVPQVLRLPEQQELDQTDLIQPDERAAQPSTSVKPDGDRRIDRAPVVTQTAALSPREIFAKVNQGVWMVVAAPIKSRNVDLENAKQGSAVAVSNHYLLTNCHILEGMDVVVILRGPPNKQMFKVSVVDSDIDTDRCVLGTEKDELEAYAAIRPSSDVAVGERVYSIGAPSGFDLTISEGLLSARRMKDDMLYFQNSAPISPGSSGGRLFDSQGNLIGITTFLLKNAQNLNFAIAAEEFVRLGKVE